MRSRHDSNKRQRSAATQRAYGSDDYWIDRYHENASGADETDEWLLGATELSPLLAGILPRDSTILDIGCGISTLTLDLLRDTTRVSRALGVDVAPGATRALEQERDNRIASGDVSARRAEFLCADLSCAPVDWASSTAFDAVFDKSTTDGLLCDTKRGARRVGAVYEAVGRVLQPSARVVLISYKPPEDGLEWLVDVVLGGLRQGTAAEDGESWWSLDVHSIGPREDEEASGADDGDAGTPAPTVYVLSKRPRRVLRRRRDPAAADDEELSVQRHWHGDG